MFISHIESMKAVQSSVYSAAVIGISWISSAGHIWSFRMRAPSGIRMEIYYWSQNCASLKDTHDNRSFCLIVISFRFIVQPYTAILIHMSTLWDYSYSFLKYVEDTILQLGFCIPDFILFKKDLVKSKVVQLRFISELCGLQTLYWRISLKSL